MDDIKLHSLLRESEGIKLDFKRELHKFNSSVPDEKRRANDEFIRDILALTNGNSTAANDTAYLILGVNDQLNSDGSRDVYDIGDISITNKSILERVNSSCNPPITDLNVKVFTIQGKRILVIWIPPSPYLHETNRRLETPKSTYNEGTVFIRRSESIFPALDSERRALHEAKQRYLSGAKNSPLDFNLPIYQSLEEINYINQKNRLDTKMTSLRGNTKAKSLIARSESLERQVKRLKTEGNLQIALIQDMYIEINQRLELALSYKNLNRDYKARALLMLAKVSYHFDGDWSTCFDYCKRSIERKNDYEEALVFGIEICQELTSSDNIDRIEAETCFKKWQELLSQLYKRQGAKS